jgi:effector-binding domain-containing protein
MRVRELEIRELAAQPTAVFHAVTPTADLGSVIDRTFPALFGGLAEIGVAPCGPPFVRYLRTGAQLEVELGVPVRGEVAELDGAQLSSLPAGRVAVWRHVGPYSGLRQACERLGTSVKELGEEAAGPFWESYVTNPVEEPDAYKRVTEIYLPLR